MRAISVDAFLRHEMASPSCAGACCRMLDNWIVAKTGASALSRFGRDFSDHSDVDAWLSEPGGIAVAVNRVMRFCSYPKTKKPRIGDVGLVFRADRLGGAILTAHGWVGRDDAGFFNVPSFWKAWAID